MKIVPTRRTDYALRALIYLAGRPSDRVNAAEIAGEMDIPTPILHQVLAELQRANLVSSQSGPKGGYRLARDPEGLPLLEIVEALEGSVHLDECALKGGPCHWEDVCAIHGVWTEAREAFAASLASHTLGEVAEVDRGLRLGQVEVPANSHRQRE
ncbi:MAG TPA: Rrf2 family transcriptional regulator [Acidimicrobiia bacterium]|nr:Rrf2 family transcriptional regulator [Acidimicrobiia bacterium]